MVCEIQNDTPGNGTYFTGGIISTKEARKLLGKSSRGLKDEDLVRIISDMVYLAESMLDYFAVPQNGKVMVKYNHGK